MRTYLVKIMPPFLNHRYDIGSAPDAAVQLSLMSTFGLDLTSTKPRFLAGGTTDKSVNKNIV